MRVSLGGFVVVILFQQPEKWIVVAGSSTTSASGSHPPSMAPPPGRRCVGQWLNEAAARKITLADHDDNQHDDGGSGGTEKGSILIQLRDGSICEPSLIESNPNQNNPNSNKNKERNNHNNKIKLTNNHNHKKGGEKNGSRKGKIQDHNQGVTKKDDENEENEEKDDGLLKRPYRVMVLLPNLLHNDSRDVLINLASTLLSAGLHVTVISFLIVNDNDDDDKDESCSSSSIGRMQQIREEILSRIPLQDQQSLRIEGMLEGMEIKMPWSRSRPLSPPPPGGEDDDHHHNDNNNNNNLTDDGGQMGNENKSLDDDDEYDNVDDVDSHLHHCRIKRISQPLEDCAIRMAPYYLHRLEQTLCYNNNNNNNNSSTNSICSQHEQRPHPTSRLGGELLPDALVSDVSFMGGLLFSELYQIPMVAYGSSQPKLLDLAIEHDPAWDPAPGRGVLYRIYRTIRQRLYSLSLTNAFLSANRMRTRIRRSRRQLQLPSSSSSSSSGRLLPNLRSPVDCLQPVVALLVDFLPSDMQLTTLPFGKRLPSGTADGSHVTTNDIDDHHHHHHRRKGMKRVIHPIQPFLPPCTPCVVEPPPWTATTNRTIPIVMVEPPSWMLPEDATVSTHNHRRYHRLHRRIYGSWVRSVIRSLTLARQSLQQYDECSWDTYTCQKDVLFEVIWLQQKPMSTPLPHVNNSSSLNMMDNNDEIEKYTMDVLPPNLPSFIHTDTSNNLLDSVIRHPTTVVAMVHCGSGHVVGGNGGSANHRYHHLHPVLWTLGVRTLCLSYPPPSHPDTAPMTADDDDNVKMDDNKSFSMRMSHRDDDGLMVVDPRRIATQLLRLLLRRQQQTQQDTMMMTNHGTPPALVIPILLEQTITIVSTIAKTNRENGPWKGIQEMQHTITTSITAALMGIGGKGDGRRRQSENNDDDNDDGERDDRTRLERHFEELQPYDAFTVLVAWIVVLSASLYVLVLKDMMTRWRRRKHHHHHSRGDIGGGSGASTNNTNTNNDGVFNRLPDLDDAWDALVVWYHDQPSLKIADTWMGGGLGGGGGRRGGLDDNDDRVVEEHMVDPNIPSMTTLGEWGGGHQQTNFASTHPNNHHHNHHGNVRRRRKVRTAR